MNLVFKVQESKKIIIVLKDGRRLITEERLTVSHDFDNMLITSLDKLLGSIKMDSTCVKSAEILGKVDENALWGMILKSIIQALRVCQEVNLEIV